MQETFPQKKNGQDEEHQNMVEQIKAARQKNPEVVDKQREEKTRPKHQGEGATLGEVATIKSSSDNESINSTEKSDDREDLPERPDSAAGSNQQETKETLGNISKLIDIEDPVIPDSVSSELDSEGSWFLHHVYEDDEWEDDEFEDEKLEAEVLIKYKTPNGETQGYEPASWEQITPRYESIEEYILALKRLRERHEEEVAKEDSDEVYKEHLAKLIQQVRHFGLIFRNQHKDKVDNV